MKTTTMLILIFVAAVVHSSLACSCMPSHSQTQFCSSDFAFKGLVVNKVEKGEEPFSGYHLYTFYVIDIYKGEDKIPGGVSSEVVVKTASGGSTCGTYFANNTEYLVEGYSNKQTGELSVNLCGGSRQFKSLKTSDLLGLNGDYDCECIIVSSHWMDDDDDSTKDKKCYGRNFLFPTKPNECLPDYNICSRKDSDKCEWGCRHNRELVKLFFK